MSLYHDSRHVYLCSWAFLEIMGVSEIESFFEGSQSACLKFFLGCVGTIIGLVDSGYWGEMVTSGDFPFSKCMLRCA